MRHIGTIPYRGQSIVPLHPSELNETGEGTDENEIDLEDDDEAVGKKRKVVDDNEIDLDDI